MSREHARRIHEDYWDAADLVMEVVSTDKMDRRRDLQTKRREYARAGIPEYWMVDPKEGQITVLRLPGQRYVVYGEFPKGEQATSHLLQGFGVDVTQALSRSVSPPIAPKRRGTRRQRP
jgi:Uma2 family endonuclease